jgi:2-polyprenyl-3-methyl-5-hydroxy-6-metoxy-1,4-benzoquinol methylase
VLRIELPSTDAQSRFWNVWNASTREITVGAVSRRQAEKICSWIVALGRDDLEIIDVGCGSGWMCESLLQFGRVTGTDLAGEVIERARARIPQVTFLAGDFMDLELPPGKADVVVSMEVLSHVADQHAFVAKLAGLLKPGGRLMLATQNRWVLERSSDVAPLGAGQIRNWVDFRRLKMLLSPHFEVIELTSVYPNWGHLGILRLVNSTKLTNLLARLSLGRLTDRMKERAFLGHTLMALAQRRI